LSNTFKPEPVDEPENTDLMIAILERIEAGEKRDHLDLMIEIQQVLDGGEDDDPWDDIVD
jgi:hypothetical protein